MCGLLVRSESTQIHKPRNGQWSGARYVAIPNGSQRGGARSDDCGRAGRLDGRGAGYRIDDSGAVALRDRPYVIERRACAVAHRDESQLSLDPRSVFVLQP